MNQTIRNPILVGEQAGRQFNVLGDTITVKISSAQTGGAFALCEDMTPVGGGTPPHIHHREDELFYVLEGEVEIWCNGETFRATAGMTALLPRNLPHNFRNVGAIPSRLLVTLMPGGFENFFAEISALGADPDLLPKLMDIAPRYGMELLPPPANM